MGALRVAAGPGLEEAVSALGTHSVPFPPTSPLSKELYRVVEVCC